MSTGELTAEIKNFFAGKYTVVELLGRGGMASVYKIKSESDGKHYALKVLHSHLAEKPESVERFLSEARSTQKLKDVPNCIRVFESGKAGQVPYFIMEMIEGWDLDRELTERGALPLPEIKRLFTQICECLSAAHEMGIIHRDIKPANMLIEKDSRRAVVTDFGIARVAYESGVTQPGTVFGTPPYMAPEQVAPEPGQTVDYRTDIYALGMMLYQMCTGGLPYSGEGIALATAYQNPQNFVPPRKLRPDIPPEVERVIVQSLSVNPAHRYATATALARAFKEALDIPTPSGGTEVQPPSQKTAVYNGGGPEAQPPYSKTPGYDKGATAAPGPQTPVKAGTESNKSSRNMLLLAGIGGAVLILVVVLVLIIVLVWQPWSGQEQSTGGAPVANQGTSASGGQGEAGNSINVSWGSVLSPSFSSRSSYAKINLNPDQVRANNASKDYYPENVADGMPSTCWTPGNHGVGSQLHFDFYRTVTIDQIGVIPGYKKYNSDKYGDRWTLNPRVAKAKISFSNGKHFILDFRDDQNMQYFKLPNVRTSYVTFTIIDYIPANRNMPGKSYKSNDTSVSEVRFWGIR